MSRPDHLLAYFGHHKCASTWIHSILDVVCTDAGWKLAYLYDESSFGDDLGAYVAREGVDFVSYVNADLPFTRSLPEFRGFHVVRDPRDLIVSAYFSHKHSHPTGDWPELIAHRDTLNKVSQDEGLLLEMEFNREYLEEMAAWDYGQENVLELRQEQISPDPYNAFLRIFAFLGVLDEEHFGKSRQLPFLFKASTNVLYRHGKLPFRRPMSSYPGERLLGIVYDNRFEKYAGGRKAGEEDVSSHYRKGQAGDWMNHFKPAHVQRFKEQYNDLLLKLGYETDADWSVAGTPATT